MDKVNDFWQGLEFGGAVDAMADAIRREDEAIFEKGDPPRDQHRKPHWPRHRAKLSVPGEGHEDVRNEQQTDRREIGGHFGSFVSGSTPRSSAAKKCPGSSTIGICAGCSSQTSVFEGHLNSATTPAATGEVPAECFLQSRKTHRNSNLWTGMQAGA